MKRKRFSVEQIVAVLKQAELGMSVADVLRRIGISEQTFYRWEKQYAGLQSDQVREFKQLQEETARLKKLVTDLSLDKAILQDVALKNGPARAEEECRELYRQLLRHRHASGLQVDQANA
jgi:putative transposase